MIKKYSKQRQHSPRAREGVRIFEGNKRSLKRNSQGVTMIKNETAALHFKNTAI